MINRLKGQRNFRKLICKQQELLVQDEYFIFHFKYFFPLKLDQLQVYGACNVAVIFESLGDAYEIVAMNAFATYVAGEVNVLHWEPPSKQT